MHISTVLVVSFMTAVLAVPNPKPKPQIINLIPELEGADGGMTITGALDTVQRGVVDVDNTVKMVTSNNTQTIANVATKVSGLGNTIRNARTAVQGAESVDIIGALGVQQSASRLTDSLSTLSNSLIAAKPAFDQAGVSPIVVMLLEQQKQNSAGLIQAVTAKVPGIAQDLSQQQSQGVSASLNRVIVAFSRSANGTVITPPLSSAPPVPDDPSSVSVSINPTKPRDPVSSLLGLLDDA